MQPIGQTERVVRNWHVFVTREFRIKPAAFGTKLLVLWGGRTGNNSPQVKAS
jgi:hypothetical protein